MSNRMNTNRENLTFRFWIWVVFDSLVQFRVLATFLFRRALRVLLPRLAIPLQEPAMYYQDRYIVVLR